MKTRLRIIKMLSGKTDTVGRIPCGLMRQTLNLFFESLRYVRMSQYVRHSKTAWLESLLGYMEP